MITLEKAIEQAEKFTDEEMVEFDHWRVVMARLLEEVKRKPFEPDWADYRTGFSNGYEQGKEDAAKFCLDHVNYADSMMDHEELLLSVSGAIKNLHYGKPSSGEIADYDSFPVVEETNEVPEGNDDGGIVIPPLTAAVLADMIDHQADELADLAKEIEIYSISHSHHADELRGAAKQLVGWAKEIREESQK